MIKEEELKKYVEEMYKKLDGKVEKSTLEQDLQRWVGEYKISLSKAVKCILQRYGVAGDEITDIDAPRFLIELKDKENNVDVHVKVLSINDKEVEVQGTKKRIYYGFIADNSGRMQYTWWCDETPTIKKGDIIKIHGAYTTSWQNEVQLNIGKKAVITKELIGDLPRYNGTPKSKIVKIDELGKTKGFVSVTGKILELSKNSITTGEGVTKEIFNGKLADETGIVPFTSWIDHNLEINDTIKIEGAYIKEFRGIPHLNFDERTMVTKTKTDIEINLDKIKSKVYTIQELQEKEGANDIRVRGIVIDLKKGSGIIYRCPECKRVLQNDSCRLHGNVNGTPDLRLKMVVDDGSGAITCVLGRELTEKLCDMTLDECIKIAREKMNTDIVREILARKVIAHPIEVTGNVTLSDYGLMLLTNSANFFTINVVEEAKKMLEALQES